MTNPNYVLNFSAHPLSERVKAHLAPCVDILVPFTINPVIEPTGEVAKVVDLAEKLVRSAGGRLDGTVPLIIVVPALGEFTAILVAELHGRLGVFPRVLCQRRSPDGTWNLYADSANLGVMDLERVRAESRGRRKVKG